MNLNRSQFNELYLNARRIWGSASGLCRMQKYNYTVEKMREIAEAIYQKTDDFLESLDKAEKECKKNEKNNRQAV